jgi:hypothetical protein|tara:strand:+ start:1440 stop:1775 length:336 start_codon:yes stop_codon:yes gene_type:complete
MQKIFNKIIIIILFFITACASSWDDIKKGLGGEKRTSTDEFLVKKKDPLVMPPKWKDLPAPGKSMKLRDEDEEVTDIEELIQLDKNQESLENLEQGRGSLEESVLEKIKQK